MRRIRKTRAPAVFAATTKKQEGIRIFGPNTEWRSHRSGLGGDAASQRPGCRGPSHRSPKLRQHDHDDFDRTRLSGVHLFFRVSKHTSLKAKLFPRGQRLWVRNETGRTREGAFDNSSESTRDTDRRERQGVCVPDAGRAKKSGAFPHRSSRWSIACKAFFRRIAAPEIAALGSSPPSVRRWTLDTHVHGCSTINCTDISLENT